MNKTHLALGMLAVGFALVLAAPIYAIEHSANYEWQGEASMEKQAGHLCNTGAEHKQVIEGEGWMQKVMEVEMEKGILTVSDTNSFITAEDALTNLTVTSAIELCAPAKHEVTPRDYVYDHEEGWSMSKGDTEKLEVFAGYDMGWEDDPGYIEGFIESIREDYKDGLFTAEEAAQMISALKAAEDMDEARKAAEGFIGKGKDEEVILAIPDEFVQRIVEALTDQVWAAQVEAAPGRTGALVQNFEAAYGEWAGITEDLEEEFSDYVDAGRAEQDQWAHTSDGIAVGEDYVGNYFYIGQLARIDEGEVKRYIDVSSPFSGALVSEEMTVLGAAEVQETFSMPNLGPGKEVTAAWYELF